MVLLIMALFGCTGSPPPPSPSGNRLIQQTSPYLLQHAQQPVDWYPWGDEAFEKARAHDRLVFLSIGYSTCHWCHVMAHESFDDPEIAALMNERFVSIKVDREERPDVDEVYMSAVQAMNRGRGGWPMTLVLTPDGEPVFAATYLPARDGDRGARRGLEWVLTKISDDWATDPASLKAHAAKVTQHLVRLSTPSAPTSVPPPQLVDQALHTLASSFDSAHAGFGGAPKFPRPVALDLLLQAPAVVPGQREMVRDTLLAMHRGGIHDPVTGGFHRYAVDEAWRVPHFEKMLYDNAQIISTATDAWQATSNDELRVLVARTVAYLSREMSLEHGGFASATDADSQAPSGELEEGAFYTWTPEEALAVVGPERAWVLGALGISAPGNLDGRSVPYRARDLTPSEAQALPAALQELAAARATRPAPLRDDKAVTAWNALTIRALARAGLAFGEPEWTGRAVQAAQFLRRSVRGPDGRMRRSYLGQPAHLAVLEDEASVALACLDLFEATGDPDWLTETAARLTLIDTHFTSPEGAWYRTPDDGDDLLLRPRDDHEGAEPSGTAMAVHALLRLSHLTGEAQWQQRADRALAALAPLIGQAPTSMPLLTAAVARRHSPATELVVVWPDESEASELLSVARAAWLPYAERVFGPARTLERLGSTVPWLEGKRPLHERATAFVCKGGVCQSPVHTAAELRAQLTAVGASLTD